MSGRRVHRARRERRREHGNVDAHVNRLRENLGPATDLIETVHGFGYRTVR